jgi:hypothetical protein
MEHNNHIWSFSTVGGVKRVNLESGNDLIHLTSLDQKLWTALSCPVNGLEIDAQTLKLIDTDNDGQIRVPEILAAVKWMTSVIKNADDLLKQDPIFPLSAIDDTTAEGRILLSSARILLKNLGKEDATTITVEETSDTEKIFATSRFNGDGVITEDTTSTVELTALLNDIISCMGSLVDRSGKQGISLEILEQFLEECTLFTLWHSKAENNTAILPFGVKTEEAYFHYSAIKSKVDDYFIRCRLAAFDTQATDALNLSVARVEAISPKDLSASLAEIAEYPLAKIEAAKALPLTVGLNPAWEKEMANFKSVIADVKFSNKQVITEAEWNSLAETFGGYIQWKAEKEGVKVESLGAVRAKEILMGAHKTELFGLIEQDKVLENEANSIILVDQLVRYYRDLFTLLKNFVTFYDFYSPGHKAIFQAGTLYIDQRSCDLCIKVSDMPKHNTMVSFSGMYLVYCDCASRSTNEKMTIVAALTKGDIDNLIVGRNALFYDRKGLDWDATVVKIVDNPISIQQAFWSPYRKISRFISTQVNKFASAQDEKATAGATKAVTDTHANAEAAAVAPPKAPAAPVPPFDIGKFVGIFAALSLALGAIGTVIASAVTGFLGLTWWKMPIALLGVMLVISGPAMFIAYLKLRKRNLAPILDANGWAINARAIVNIKFGNTLTHLAELPKGAKINLTDPFSKKGNPVFKTIIALVIIGAIVYWLWHKGII